MHPVTTVTTPVPFCKRSATRRIFATPTSEARPNPPEWPLTADTSFAFRTNTSMLGRRETDARLNFYRDPHTPQNCIDTIDFTQAVPEIKRFSPE